MPTLPQKGAPHKLAEVDWAAALEADMQVVVRRAIEHIVDAELTALLGPRYAWDATRVGYRHGTRPTRGGCVRSMPRSCRSTSAVATRAGSAAPSGRCCRAARCPGARSAGSSRGSS